MTRALALYVMVGALTAQAASNEPKHLGEPTSRVWYAVLIGAPGLALAGGYSAGACSREIDHRGNRWRSAEGCCLAASLA